MSKRNETAKLSEKKKTSGTITPVSREKSKEETEHLDSTDAFLRNPNYLDIWTTCSTTGSVTSPGVGRSPWEIDN